MNRRAFLSLLGAAAVAPLVPKLAPKVVTAAAPAVSRVHPSWVGLTLGDVVTIDGVFRKDPFTGVETDHLQQFVITETIIGPDEPSMLAPVFPPFDARLDEPCQPFPGPCRADVLYGWSGVKPDLACRMEA